MSCVPQRFLANNRNLLRTAVLTASSVQPVDQSIIEIPTGRLGTAQVLLTGDYTGEEEALYEIEVLDDIVNTKIPSTAISSGAGSGTLTNITTSLAAQTIVVQLQDAGIPTLRAGIDFEGVRIVARADGDAGNGIFITIDQSSLVFTPQPFSLLDDLKAGAGGPTTGIVGSAFDWDTKVLGGDNIIPTSAHRISFGDDTSHIHLQYKQYVDGVWTYHFVPAIERDIPKGTRVNFVTGGRTVTIEDGETVPLAPPETYFDVETVYDLLNDIKTQSLLVDIDGVVALDRSPTGQAATELLARTDAHVDPSSGSGSAAATGFVDTFANSNAATELITATCFAVTAKDNPLARLGSERWKLAGSVSGALGTIVTGIPFVDPDDKFGLTIPIKLPDNFGGQKGRFSDVGRNYMPRDPGVDPYSVAAICPVGMKLGPEAVDQTLTLTYTKRPAGDCLCKGMPIPNLSGPCLGITEPGDDENVGYQSDTVGRLKDLYAFKATTVSTLADIGEGVEALLISGDSAGLASLNTIVRNFETVLAQIDPLIGTLRTDGNTAWDAAFVQLKADIRSIIGTQEAEYEVEAMESINEGQPVQLVFDGDTVKAWVFSSDAATSFMGWAAGDMTAGASAGKVRVKGLATGLSALTVGTKYYFSLSSPGVWTTVSASGVPSGTAVDATTIDVDVNTTSFVPGPFPEDLYNSKMDLVLISAGISPLGKADDSTLISGDGCWRDYGGDFWTVVGSDGAYAPLFSNHKYWGCRLSEDGKAYFSTHEFGLQLNIKCPQNLLYGDQVILQIGGAGWGATYQVGDILTLPIIAAQPLQLAGGQDGNDILVWYVSGSVAGALPNFTYDPATPAAYDAGGGSLVFTYMPGGIPNAKGDRFTFAIEGGHYRWRKNGGPWMGSSPPEAIILGPDTFDSGLSIEFVAGDAPSFVAGDLFRFTADQPWAVSNLLTPNRERWQWTGAAPDLVADMGAPALVGMVAIARHTLPVGTTLLLEGGIVAGVYTWSEALTYNADTIVKEFPQQTARYLRLTLANATGGGIGWFPAFESGLTTSLSALVQLRRSYNVEASSGGLDQGGKFLARTMSGSVSWSEAALDDTDVQGLAALLDWVKEQDDEPFCLVPNITRPDEAYMVHVGVDGVDFAELSDYNADVMARARRYDISMPLTGVWK